MIMFNPTYNNIYFDELKQCDCKEFYGEVEEAITRNDTEPHSKEVDLRMYADSDHDGEISAKLLYSSINIFLDRYKYRPSYPKTYLQIQTYLRFNTKILSTYHCYIKHNQDSDTKHIFQFISIGRRFILIIISTNVSLILRPRHQVI